MRHRDVHPSDAAPVHADRTATRRPDPARTMRCRRWRSSGTVRRDRVVISQHLPDRRLAVEQPRQLGSQSRQERRRSHVRGQQARDTLLRTRQAGRRDAASRSAVSCGRSPTDSSSMSEFRPCGQSARRIGARQSAEAAEEGPVVPELVGHLVVHALGVLALDSVAPERNAFGDQHAGTGRPVIVGEQHGGDGDGKVVGPRQRREGDLGLHLRAAVVAQRGRRGRGRT